MQSKMTEVKNKQTNKPHYYRTCRCLLLVDIVCRTKKSLKHITYHVPEFDLYTSPHRRHFSEVRQCVYILQKCECACSVSLSYLIAAFKVKNASIKMAKAFLTGPCGYRICTLKPYGILPQGSNCHLAW